MDAGVAGGILALKRLMVNASLTPPPDLRARSRPATAAGGMAERVRLQSRGLHPAQAANERRHAIQRAGAR